MHLSLRFIVERMNITDPQDISPNPMARTTTMETKVDPAERDTVTTVQTTETEGCGSSPARLVQLPPPPVTPVVSMVIDTGSLEDQYRPMTPGEEEIMRIYEDGIYRTSDLIERTGGLWITGRIPPSSEPPLFSSEGTEEIVDTDPELDELLRDSPDNSMQGFTGASADPD